MPEDTTAEPAIRRPVCRRCGVPITGAACTCGACTMPIKGASWLDVQAPAPEPTTDAAALLAGFLTMARALHAGMRDSGLSAPSGSDLHAALGFSSQLVRALTLANQCGDL